jgi:hypothetical protein
LRGGCRLVASEVLGVGAAAPPPEGPQLVNTKPLVSDGAVAAGGDTGAGIGNTTMPPSIFVIGACTVGSGTVGEAATGVGARGAADSDVMGAAGIQAAGSVDTIGVGTGATTGAGIRFTTVERLARCASAEGMVIKTWVASSAKRLTAWVDVRPSDITRSCDILWTLAFLFSFLPTPCWRPEMAFASRREWLSCPLRRSHLPQVMGGSCTQILAVSLRDALTSVFTVFAKRGFTKPERSMRARYGLTRDLTPINDEGISARCAFAPQTGKP